MDSIIIFEKLYDNIYNIFNISSSYYHTSLAIYKTWYYGSELEKNLADRLYSILKKYLIDDVKDKYGQLKYQEDRPEFIHFKKCLIETYKIKYKDHEVILKILNELNYE